MKDIVLDRYNKSCYANGLYISIKDRLPQPGKNIQSRAEKEVSLEIVVCILSSHSCPHGEEWKKLFPYLKQSESDFKETTQWPEYGDPGLNVWIPWSVKLYLELSHVAAEPRRETELGVSYTFKDSETCSLGTWYELWF